MKREMVPVVGGMLYFSFEYDLSGKIVPKQAGRGG